MSSIADVLGLVGQSFPDRVWVQITIFESGAVDIVAKPSDGRVVLLQSNQELSQFGLTPDLNAEGGEFNSGHPLLFSNHTEAIRAMVLLVG